MIMAHYLLSLTASSALLLASASRSKSSALHWQDVKCFMGDMERGDDAAARPPAAGAAHHAQAQAEATFLSRTNQRGDDAWDPKSVEDLEKQYDTIFKPYESNRNAGSHHWATFILSRSSHLSHEQIEHMFSGFCPVSGSPLSEPSPGSRYKSTLSMASGAGHVTGYTYHCCWPCICDEVDLVKVDNKTITDKAQTEKQYTFTVIGDPCVNSPPACTEEGESGCIPLQAPAVKCEGGKLVGATLSDGGHVIIGMYHVGKDYAAGEFIDYETAEDESKTKLKDSCVARQEAGYDSGMGAIFQQVARLNRL